MAKNRFFTPVELPPTSLRIGRETTILSMGSCFSDHIGKKLSDLDFSCYVNPFGTVFNPLSISRLLDFLVASDDKFDLSDGVDSQKNRWFHYDFHSSFDTDSHEELLQNIIDRIQDVSRFIHNLDILILTLGTSIAYQKKDLNRVVSNCHKMPASFFDKVLLEINDMEEALSSSLERLRQRSSGINVILTVSPVRHIKNGLVEDRRSKSRLIELVHRLCESHNYCQYFPAYEIMNDELRDYRFFADDLIHPSMMAVDIIWERFCDLYFDVKTKEYVRLQTKLLAQKKHQPISRGKGFLEKR